MTFNLSGVSTDVTGTTQVISLTSPAAQSATSTASIWMRAATSAAASSTPLASTTTGKRCALVSGSPISITNLLGTQAVTGTYKAQ